MPLHKHLVEPGSILQCINWPKCPKQNRPVLVLAKYKDSVKETVFVAYGTGQRTMDKNSRGLKQSDLEISAEECKRYNLSESTRFDLKNCLIFDLNEENFSMSLSRLDKQKQEEMKSKYIILKPIYRSILNQ